MEIRKPVPLGRWAAVFLLILGAAAAIAVLSVRRVAEARWDRMSRRIEELQAEKAARSYERPVLRGDPLPGNAWDDYAAAFNATPVGLHDAGVRTYLRGPGGATAAQVKTWMEDFAPALDLLRRGTRRAEVRVPIKWDHTFNPHVSTPGGYHSLDAAVLLKARVLLTEGKPEDAGEYLMDALQFGRDLLQSGTRETETWGIFLVDHLSRDLHDLLQAKTLSGEGLARLDRELEILDRAWPSRAPLFNHHLLALGLGLQREVQLGYLMYQGSLNRSLVSWRWEYSSRLRAGSTFLWAEEHLQAMGRLEEAPWSPMNQPHVDTYSPDEIVRDTVLFFASDPRRGRARTRLLRTAARYQLSGEPLDLEDPYGGRLRRSVTAGVLRAWSVGHNGVDDGGLGTWWNNPLDIVIETPR